MCEYCLNGDCILANDGIDGLNITDDGECMEDIDPGCEYFVEDK